MKLCGFVICNTLCAPYIVQSGVMFRRQQMLALGGITAIALLALSLYSGLSDRSAGVPQTAVTDAPGQLAVRPGWQTTPLPDQSEPQAAPEPASALEPQMPKALADPAIQMQGLVGVSLEVGAGKPQTFTVNASDVLLNKGLMLVGAKARLLGMGLPELPVNAVQAFVGAPITISVGDALKALGGGDAASLVGGVPLFLEVTSTDSAGQTHVTRTPFEVTNRDLQADANAVLEPPPLMPALSP